MTAPGEPEFFDGVYRSAAGDGSAVPWAGLEPHPTLVRWLANLAPVDRGRRALVVGCGLGDDAEELARYGFRVDAFDLSPTAIAWCRRRFRRSRVAYEVADLFEPFRGWYGAFDLVVEINTVQSLPPEMHLRAISSVAGFVAPGGTLFVRCSGREDSEPTPTRPFPLSRGELGGFVAAGLVEQSFQSLERVGRYPTFVATYVRPSV